jgi:hypothetical protein
MDRRRSSKHLLPSRSCCQKVFLRGKKRRLARARHKNQPATREVGLRGPQHAPGDLARHLDSALEHLAWFHRGPRCGPRLSAAAVRVVAFNRMFTQSRCLSGRLALSPSPKFSYETLAARKVRARYPQVIRFTAVGPSQFVRFSVVVVVQHLLHEMLLIVHNRNVLLGYAGWGGCTS